MLPRRAKPAIYSMGREAADELLLGSGIEIGTYLFRTSKRFTARCDLALTNTATQRDICAVDEDERQRGEPLSDWQEYGRAI